jgi:hypothetical protein
MGLMGEGGVLYVHHLVVIPCFRWMLQIPMHISHPWWMRSSRLTANAVIATVLGSIPASSDTVESEGRQMKQC